MYSMNINEPTYPLCAGCSNGVSNCSQVFPRDCGWVSTFPELVERKLEETLSYLDVTRPLLPKRHKQLTRQTRAAAPSTPRLFNMGTVANESFKAKVR